MEEVEKLGFFKSALISIKDFEKYHIFMAETLRESIKYLCILVLIFSIIVTFVFEYKIINGSFEEEFIEMQNEINQDLGVNIQEIQKIVNQNKVMFFIVLFIILFAVYFTSTIIDAIMLGFLAEIITRILGIIITYKASFNIGVHALTLPILLQTIYVIVNVLFDFTIKYFSWAYTTISFVYVVVAILFLKTDLINQQMELMKIQMEQEKIKEEMQEDEDKEEKDENKDNKKDDKENKDEKKEDTNLKQEPEGTA